MFILTAPERPVSSRNCLIEDFSGANDSKLPNQIHLNSTLPFDPTFSPRKADKSKTALSRWSWSLMNRAPQPSSFLWSSSSAHLGCQRYLLFLLPK